MRHSRQPEGGDVNANKPADQTTETVEPNQVGDFILGTNISYYLIIGKTLGKGTFGKVKLATHVITKEKVLF